MAMRGAPVCVDRRWQSQQVRDASIRETMAAWQRMQFSCTVRRPAALNLMGSGTMPERNDAVPLVPSTPIRRRWGAQ